MNITAISFSYSDDSMNYRGLKMMNHFINFDNLGRINLPICNVNGPDDKTPKELDKLHDTISKSDKLVFAIPEYSGHYSVGFKNFMDWLVVKSNYNADLGQDYCITDKSIYVMVDLLNIEDIFQIWDIPPVPKPMRLTKQHLHMAE